MHFGKRSFPMSLIKKNSSRGKFQDKIELSWHIIYAFEMKRKF